jgi:hypothetical protein
MTNQRTAQDLAIHLPPLRPAARNAARLLTEATLVPSALFALLIHTSGLVSGIAAAVGWCWLVVLVRARSGRRLPGMLVLSACLFTARSCVALATSSAFLYVLQPALASIVTALLFLGTSLVGRPLTARLAQDFIHVPAHLLARPRVRRMFRDVGILWGLSRVADAAMTYGFLRRGVDAGIAGRALVSPVLLAITIGLCFLWGRRCLRNDGIRLKRAQAAAA